MLRHVCAVTVAVAVFLSLASTAGASDDEPLIRPGATLDPAQRVMVVGDLHGDMQQTLNVLAAVGAISEQPDYYQRKLNEGVIAWLQDPFKADRMPLDRTQVNPYMIYNKRGHLVNEQRADVFHWAGGVSTLVIVGDAMNVGPDDIDILYLIKRVSSEATAAGGRLVFLLGNHELQNLQGNYSGVHPWSFETSGGAVGRTRLLSMRTPLGRFLRACPLMYYRDGALFVHGGITGTTVRTMRKLLAKKEEDDDEKKPRRDEKSSASHHHANNTSNASSSNKAKAKEDERRGERNEKKTSSATPHAVHTVAQLVKAVNRRARSALESLPLRRDGARTSRISDPLARFVLGYDYAPVESQEHRPTLVHPLLRCEEVIAANRELELEMQVVGHTPHAPPEYQFCDGQLLAVDFGMSRWKAGPGSAFAGIELYRAPRRHEHTHGPAQGDLGWHTALVMPQPSQGVAAGSDEQGRDWSAELARARALYNWKTFGVALLMCVVAVEAARCYLSRRCARSSSNADAS